MSQKPKQGSRPPKAKPIPTSFSMPDHLAKIKSEYDNNIYYCNTEANDCVADAENTEENGIEHSFVFLTKRIIEYVKSNDFLLEYIYAPNKSNKQEPWELKTSLTLWERGESGSESETEAEAHEGMESGSESESKQQLSKNQKRRNRQRNKQATEVHKQRHSGSK